jgi:hypothetical protein
VRLVSDAHDLHGAICWEVSRSGVMDDMPPKPFAGDDPFSEL